MAKNLKLNIKNEQLAQAINLNNIKGKIAKGKEGTGTEDKASKNKPSKQVHAATPSEPKEEAPRIKARTRSAFADASSPPTHADIAPPASEESSPGFEPLTFEPEEVQLKPKSNAELRRKIFGDELDEISTPRPPEPLPEPQHRPKTPPPTPLPRNIVEAEPSKDEKAEEPRHVEEAKPAYEKPAQEPQERQHSSFSQPQHKPRPHHQGPPRPAQPQGEKLGPTGKHINDLLVKQRPPRQDRPHDRPYQDRPPRQHGEGDRGPREGDRAPREGDRGPREYRDPRSDFRGPRPGGYGSPRPAGSGYGAPRNTVMPPPEPKDKDNELRKKPPKPKETTTLTSLEDLDEKRKTAAAKAKDFRDVKQPARKQEQRSFDARDKHGLRTDEDSGWRKKRAVKGRKIIEDTTIRPTSLAVRLPISVKDLASEMKLKASQLIAKLFMQGIAVTLNDLLEDETVLQLLGHEFGCEITIDRKEEDRIRITDKTIREEIKEQDAEKLVPRAPVVAFMGHVDHGKTSLIDAIRSSNRVASEAGAITQHIGAFRCSTAIGDIAILDTPGHEAFSAMRARGADVTDIVVLVVAGDEGIRQQTIEAINHAKAANVTIVVAINKSDKPNFNPENVYRQLADQELLPEVWGGQTITINCSAVTGAGVNELLEMLALQSEVLELKAQPNMRARGSVLESELHKGLGNVATVLVQNGTLKKGDCLVFSQHWGRVKTMRTEFGESLDEAGPSTPVAITGLSGLPAAGEEFIVVKSEKEAREIADARSIGVTQKRMQLGRKITAESFMTDTPVIVKKTLNLIVRADVQGSLEALRTALEKIHSEKVELNIIMSGVGEISESDVQMAVTSNAMVLGFHTAIEGHADALIKQFGVRVYLHDIIYHAIDQVKELMSGMLDKISEEHERGVVEVKATFKSSHYGIIAGCQVLEGTIHRSHLVRLRRGKDIVWKGNMSSLRREKEDVREVQKGFECGVVLNGTNDIQAGDKIETYEIVYKAQEL